MKKLKASNKKKKSISNIKTDFNKHLVEDPNNNIMIESFIIRI